MLKVTNGSVTLTVTMGAFKNFYAKCGFHAVDAEDGVERAEVVTTQPTPVSYHSDDSSHQESEENYDSTEDDEYDEEEEIIDKIDDNTYLVDGDVSLDDLDEEIGVTLESESSETIGGFILDIVGEIPDESDVGRIVEYENYQFKIMAIGERRIERVKIYIIGRCQCDDSIHNSEAE